MHATPVQLVAPTLDATAAVAAVIAGAARPGDVIVLAGEMGAGKTAFAKAFGAALGVVEPITSPTFTLVQTYECVWRGRPLQLHHADIYRLDQLSEVADLAFGELAEFGGIVLVEWGDVVAGALGDHLLVHLEPIDDESGVDDSGIGESPVPTGRRLTVTPHGDAWSSRWSALQGGLPGAGSGVTPC